MLFLKSITDCRYFFYRYFTKDEKNVVLLLILVGSVEDMSLESLLAVESPNTIQRFQETKALGRPSINEPSVLASPHYCYMEPIWRRNYNGFIHFSTKLRQLIKNQRKLFLQKLAVTLAARKQTERAGRQL